MIQTKSYDLKALDVDTSKKRVKIAFSHIGNVDRDNDIITAGAFSRTFAAKGPTGTNEIWHLLDHGWRISDSALSKYTELGIEGNYAYGVAPYIDTFAWREIAWPLYEAGQITQHSFGFRIVKASRPDDNSPRIIEEVEMFEGSAVLWGANPETPTMDVVKNFIKQKEESIEDRVKWILKCLKDGRYSGENESLLTLDLMQLTAIQKAVETPSDTPPQGSPTGLSVFQKAAIAHKIDKLKTYL